MNPIESIRQYCFQNRYSLRQSLIGLRPYISLKTIQKKVSPPLVKYIQDWVDLHDMDTDRVDKYKLFDEMEQGMPSFVIVVPSYNNEKYVSVNLNSIYQQTYPFFRVIYINDASTDDTDTLVKKVMALSRAHDKTIYLHQNYRQTQTCGRFQAYHLCDDDEIICMVDGDDWLSNNQALYHVAKAYQDDTLTTYGCYQYFHKGSLQPFVYGRESFEPSVIENKTFRYTRWVSCHLRTGYAGLFKRINLRDLLETNQKRFYRCCTDLAEMYPVLEMASPYIKMIPQSLYIYNKDASCQNNNSYFNADRFPAEKRYREMIQDQLRVKPRYDSLIKKEIIAGRYNRTVIQHRRNGDGENADYIAVGNSLDFEKEIDNLGAILDLSQLPLLGIELDIKPIFFLYSTDICIGTLQSISLPMREYIIAKNRENSIQDESLIGEMVVSIGRNSIPILKKFFSNI